MTNFTPHYEHASNPAADDTFVDAMNAWNTALFLESRGREHGDLEALEKTVTEHPAYVYNQAKSYSNSDGDAVVYVAPDGAITWTTKHHTLPQGAIVIGEYRGGNWYAVA